LYGFRFLFLNKLKEGRTDNNKEYSFPEILHMKYFTTCILECGRV
jgi:hypothetical protein